MASFQSTASRSSGSVDSCPLLRPLPQLDGAGVLMVDDDLAVLSITSEMLSLIGCGVFRARSGQEAVDCFRENKGKISILITDLAMPAMDGFELIEEIRRLDPSARIVVCSGSIFPEVKGKLDELAVDVVLPKPFTSAELMEVLVKLQAGGVRGAAPEAS